MLEDVFSVQRDVAERASASLALGVLPPADSLSASQTKSRAARNAYLKARHFRDQGTEEGFYRAIDYVRLAIAEDPLYARAYAGLASCQCLLAGHGLEVLPPDEAMPKAKEFANKALQLDTGLAEAHAVLGMVRLKYEWDFAGAEENFLRALELNPSYAQAHFWYSPYLEAMGRGEEAVLQGKTGSRAQPDLKRRSREPGDAIGQHGSPRGSGCRDRRGHELDAGFWGTRWVLGNLHLKQGDYAKATAAFQKQSKRNSVSLTSLGFAYARAGRRSEAEVLLQELAELREERYL